MKKKLFAVFSACSLILSGCTFQDFTDWVGNNIFTPIKNIFSPGEKEKEDDKKEEDKPTDTTKPCNHTDENHDGTCDLCGQTGMTVTHVDNDHDGTCDVCHQDGIEVVHVDADHDGYCDTCDTFFQEPSNIDYVTNAYEHWYVDSHGVEHRESHVFDLVNHTDKTCTETEIDEYECSKCEFRKLVKGSEYAEHHYHSEITKEPTCHEPGIITFTCHDCGESYTSEIPINKNAHNYVEHSEAGGVKTLKCTLCDDEKTFIDHSSSQTAEITSSELQQAKEVQLQEASIQFDEETLANDITENVTIGAEKKEVETVVSELNLDTSVQEKLEGQPVIDLSMVDNSTNENISTFSGSVKVRIPYQIKENEDPNEIAIWYLSEEEPETIKAEYVDGNVSFETTHFSYYAVVHLDVEEICEQFGHYEVETVSVPSTCHALGFQEHVCLRCHKAEKTFETNYAPHDYEFVEMVEPTTTTEGYVRKECKICHDYQDTVLPKVLPDEESYGFYENFYRSVLTPDFKVVASVTLDDKNLYQEMYVGEDEEGQYFQYDARDNSTFTYKGKQYYSYHVSNRDDYNPFATFDIIKVVLAEIPKIYKEKAEELIGWFIDKYFIKTEISEGYEIRLNSEALYDTYLAFRDNTLEDAIKLTIGEETYAKIFDFVEDNYDKPLSEFIELLDEKGFSLEALYDSVKRIMTFVVGEDFASQMPPFNELIPADLMDMSVSQVVNLLLNMFDLSSLFRPHSSVAQPDEPISHGSYPIHRGPEEQEEEPQEPEIVQIIPETYEELMELVEHFLGSNLFELIAGFTEKDSKDEIVEMVDRVALDFKNNVELVLNTTKTGAFISIFASISEMHNPTYPDEVAHDIYAYVTKSFDKAGILKTLSEKAQDVSRFYEGITISSTNYEWFLKPIEESLSREYPGIKFDWVYDPNDTKSPTSVKFVSKQSYTKTFDGQTLTGKVVLPLQRFDGLVQGINKYGEPYQYYSYIGSIVTNNSGRGTKLPKGHRGYVTHSLYYTPFGIFEPTSIEESSIHIPLSSCGILYDIDDEKFIYSTEYGSFSYLTQDDREVVNVEHVNYEDLTEHEQKYYDKQDDYDCTFFYVTYSDGSRSLTYIYNNSDEKTVVRMPVIHKAMNDEALELFGNIYYCWDYVDGKVVKHIDTEYGKLPFDVGAEYHHYYSFNIDENYSEEFNFGNARVTYFANKIQGQPPCVRSISWKVYVNGNIIYSTSYRAHFGIEALCSENSTIIKEGCVAFETINCVCDYCGRTVLTREYEYEDHNFGSSTEEIIHEGSLTQPEITFTTNTCEDCGYEDEIYSYKQPCEHDWMHWDEEKEMYVCNDCGFESLSLERPVFEFERIDETEDTITFSFFTPTDPYSWMYEDNFYDGFTEYSYELCLGYLDEEKSVQIINDPENPNVAFDIQRITVGEVYNLHNYYDDYTLMRTVTFDKQVFLDLLHSAEGQEEQLYMAIAVTRNIGAEPSGDIFYFLVEM